MTRAVALNASEFPVTASTNACPSTATTHTSVKGAYGGVPHAHQSRLAEALARRADPHRRALDGYLDIATDDDVEAVGRVTLAHDHLVARHRRDNAVGDELEHGR